MVVDKTLYDVLDVHPNATQQDIIKACKKKSLEHHPDRGGSVEMMQKVNAAKEILTDADKRKTYDRYGLEGMKSTMGNEHFSGFPGGLFDIFDIFNNGRGRRDQSRVSKGTDIKHGLKVSLEELYSGTTKKVEIDRDVACTNCRGTGSNDGIDRKCRECDGTGIETLIYRMGPILQQRQGQCSKCHGNGNEIDSKNRCKKCFGKKLLREKKFLDVNISHGSQNEEIIKFIGEANQSPSGESGTVYIVLQQEDHPLFGRNNDDLTMKMEINLAESLCGFQRVIKLLDGHQLLINHPYGKPILPNSYQCIKGYGMPNRFSHEHGDLIIQFNVKFPQDNFIANEDQQKLLESLLPPKSNIKLNDKEHYQQAEMSEYDIHRQRFQREQFQNGHHHHHHQHQQFETENDFQEPQHIQCGTQ